MLFTVALMPWLRQHRHRREKVVDVDSNDDINNSNKSNSVMKARIRSLERSNEDMKRTLAAAVSVLKHRGMMTSDVAPGKDNNKAHEELETFLSMYKSMNTAASPEKSSCLDE